MTDNNSTQFASSTLPVSNRPLMDFNCLYTTRCKVLDSLEIAPPPDWSVYGPNGDLFEYPIQVVVLGIDGDQAKLGFYAHPALVVKQGPPPHEEWMEAWTNDPDFQTESTSQEVKKDEVKIKEPHHPLIMGNDCHNIDNCADVLDRTVAVFDLFTYLDFRYEEINREASDGLFYLNYMVEHTVKYVSEHIKQKAEEDRQKKDKEECSSL